MPSKYRLGISSMSLGRAWVHPLSEKLQQASSHGFEGIEIFYEDLEYLAKEQFSKDDTVSSQDLISATQTVKKLCNDNGLTVICLQPFSFYEGLLDRKEHDARIEKLKIWFQLIKILETDIVQIPSNFMTKEEITGDMDIIIADLQQVADMGLKETPTVRFVYESLAWGTYVDTWEKAWEIVTKVDRPNFGICLDTFNIAGRVYGDPASPTGMVEDEDKELEESMQRMVKTIDVKKVFYVQVVDAEKMREPLVEGHAFHMKGQPPRMSWSRNARLFAFEEGGYLPIVKVLKTITKGLGYEGWISLELFSRTMAESQPSVPREHAKRGIESWSELVKAMGWEKTDGKT